MGSLFLCCCPTLASNDIIRKLKKTRRSTTLNGPYRLVYLHQGIFSVLIYILLQHRVVICLMVARIGGFSVVFGEEQSLRLGKNIVTSKGGIQFVTVVIPYIKPLQVAFQSL